MRRRRDLELIRNEASTADCGLASRLNVMRRVEHKPYPLERNHVMLLIRTTLWVIAAYSALRGVEEWHASSKVASAMEAPIAVEVGFSH
jgi:hypothetical protein